MGGGVALVMRVVGQGSWKKQRLLCPSPTHLQPPCTTPTTTPAPTNQHRSGSNKQPSTKQPSTKPSHLQSASDHLRLARPHSPGGPPPAVVQHHRPQRRVPRPKLPHPLPQHRRRADDEGGAPEAGGVEARQVCDDLGWGVVGGGGCGG